ncbi:MAG: secretin N-terminal domain-containing protein [Methylophilaceae bacterium]
MTLLNIKTLNSLNFFALILFCTLQLTGCVSAPWDTLKFSKKPVETQVSMAKQEVEQKPEELVPRKNLLVTQESAVTKLMSDADKAKNAGNYQDANAIYDRILVMMPNEARAINGKATVERELANNKKIEEARALFGKNKADAAKKIMHKVLLQSPNNIAALSLQQEIMDKVEAISNEPPRLNPKFDKPVTLELRDTNIKVVFEVLSRITGINFILDKDIKPDTKTTIFIKKAKVEDAIDLVLSTNGLQKKALSDNTALIFPYTQQKLKDYQDLVIRSFYLSNTSARQVAALLKTMLKTKDIFVDDRLNMIVMRDTPEATRIAERLVAANDLEDPEVMLEVEILEISRSRLQELGIEYPNRLAVTTPTPLTLKILRDDINSSLIGVSPNPALNFKKMIDDVTLLSNPRIRVRNNEKAKILVGDKVPIITSTAVANAGVSESVQYIDVGLKLDVEPRITMNDYVNIKIALEVSSLGAKTVTPAGTVAYTIGTRNASTLLRLKNNETQILAGLISDDERKNASRLPGIGDIPLLGRLFSNQRDNKNKTEIVLAITPRILGNIVRPQAELTEYWSGTENVITDRPKISIPTTSMPSDPRETFKESVTEPQIQSEAPQPEDSVTTEPIAEPESSNLGSSVLAPYEGENSEKNIASDRKPIGR